METSGTFASGNVKNFNKVAGFGYINMARGAGKTVLFYYRDGRMMVKGQDRGELQPAFTEEAISKREPKKGDDVLFMLIDVEGAGEVGIEFAGRHRRLADIALPRRLAKAARHGCARPMRFGEVGPAVPGIIRRRLKSGRCPFPSPLGGGRTSLRANARAALADRGIKQIRQRRVERRRVRPRRLGARRLGRILFRMLCRIALLRRVRSIGAFRHGPNMGRVR